MVTYVRFTLKALFYTKKLVLYFNTCISCRLQILTEVTPSERKHEIEAYAVSSEHQGETQPYAVSSEYQHKTQAYAILSECQDEVQAYASSCYTK